MPTTGMTQTLQELCPLSDSSSLTISSLSSSLPNTAEPSTRELDCGRSEIPTNEGGWRTDTCLCVVPQMHTFGCISVQEIINVVCDILQLCQPALHGCICQLLCLGIIKEVLQFGECAGEIV